MSRVMSTTTEELAISAQSGDTETIMALWERVRGYVYKQARRWRPQDADDLKQAGVLALYRALPYYDPARGSFLWVYSQKLKCEFVRAVFGGRSAKCLNDPIHVATSLNAPLTTNKGDEADELLDFIADPCDLVEDAERQDAREAVLRALHALDEPEQQIIRLRYYNALTQAQAAQRAKITLREAKRLEASALRKLRAPTISRSLRQYL